MQLSRVALLCLPALALAGACSDKEHPKSVGGFAAGAGSTTSSSSGAGGNGGSGGGETGGGGAGTGAAGGGGGAMGTCNDGQKNGDETDIDCGGSCMTCPLGMDCLADGDCQSGSCDQGQCVGPGCVDGVKNNEESDIDCGGFECAPCGVGDDCLVGHDCDSSVCNSGTCASPTCSDGAANGAETDIDCGGGVCGPCGNLGLCAANTDCASGLCVVIQCQGWTRAIGGGGTERTRAVALDPSTGHLVAVVSFTGTIDVGGDSYTSAGGTDLLVVESASSGTEIWTRAFGSAADDTPVAVAVDANGSVFVAATIGGAIDFGGGAVPFAGGSDVAVVALSGVDGAHLWSQAWGSAMADTAQALDVSPSGDVAVAGLLGAASVDFGGGALASIGTTDAFVAVRSNDGGPLWAKRYGGAGATTQASAVRFDGLGALFLGGSFSGAADLGTGTLTSAGGADAFVVKTAAGGGAATYAKRYGGAGDEAVTALATSPAGDVVLAGHAHTGADFGAGGAINAMGADLFVARLDGASGNTQWARSGGSANDDGVGGVALGPDGDVYVAGRAGQACDLGGGALAFLGGSTDGLLLRLQGGTGAHVNSQLVGGAGDDLVTGLVVNGATGNLLFGGGFSGTATFAGTPVSSAGPSDGFVTSWGLFP